MFSVTREIGIDMGHRVMTHGSKCKSIHGHRYTVHATCESKELIDSGVQQGMVVDFSFLKEEMLREIDEPCDHGLVMSRNDPLLTAWGIHATDHYTKKGCVEGGCLTEWAGGKLYIVEFIPTAENLAEHWFQRLAPRVIFRSQGNAHLKKVRVWETPNCFADYPS